MCEHKYKVGDRVKIKSLDWYNKNKDKYGIVELSTHVFVPGMSQFCGKVATIEDVFEDTDGNIMYYMKEIDYDWTDEMIEGLVEEETKNLAASNIPDGPYTVTYDSPSMNDSISKNIISNEITLPEGYIFKDENANVINATKIVLEKKKKEYPKTYAECCKVIDYALEGETIIGYKASLLRSLQKLLICRDAYWKIAGDEMGLGKPWKPDWDNVSDKYCIYFVSGYAWSKECQTRQCPFAFPTPEMRDAFKENFDPDIEICKELL